MTYVEALHVIVDALQSGQLTEDELIGRQVASLKGQSDPAAYMRILREAEIALARELLERRSRTCAGFDVQNTGGGCLALVQLLPDGWRALITDTDDADLPRWGEQFALGIYDANDRPVLYRWLPADTSDEQVAEIISATIRR